MIDDPDYSNSTIRLLIFQALKQWEIGPLFNLLFDEDYIVRSAAARELQLRGDTNTFHQLQKHINDSRAYVREICAFTIGQFGTPSIPYREESVPLLLYLLDDLDIEVKSTAIYAIGHLFSETTMPENVAIELISLVEDDSEQIRCAVAFALASSPKSQSVIIALNKLKRDCCKDVQSWAEMSLSILQDKHLD